MMTPNSFVTIRTKYFVKYVGDKFKQYFICSKVVQEPLLIIVVISVTRLGDF